MRDLAGSIAGLEAIWARGPSMHKEPDDLARYQLLIDRIEPNVVVETGLYYGGSHHWFASRVPHVISVESNPEEIERFTGDVLGFGAPPDNGLVIRGHSHDVFDQVVAEVTRLGGPVLVSLDSDHGTENVYGEMIRYGHLVTPGSYMVVEDGIYHWVERPDLCEGDPIHAIERYLAERDGWVVDLGLEDAYPTTQHPSGWLRRT